MQIVIANDDCLAYAGIMRRQSQFGFRTWGGKRRGAGRKRVATRPQVAHRPRERVNAQHPILVTTRVMPDVARLRTKVMYEAIQAALAGATKWMYEPEPVRFVHASVQGNHLHLLVEAASNEALSRAMKGFLVSCAKRLNKVAGRRGRVFADRFHTRMLATPTAVRNALRHTLAYASHCTSLSMEKSDPIAVGDPRL
jgi:putative transposase